jgi:hypothetical protein
MSSVSSDSGWSKFMLSRSCSRSPANPFPVSLGARPTDRRFMWRTDAFAAVCGSSPRRIDRAGGDSSCRVEGRQHSPDKWRGRISFSLREGMAA